MAVDMILDVMRAAQPAPATLKKLGKAPENAASGSKSLFAAVFARAKPEVSARPVKIPADDLVANVMAAADPGKRAIATAKLQEGGDDTGPVSVASADERTRKAYQALESSLMANALQSMMPEGEDSLYGSGTAGNVWRGMMVNELADAATQNGLFNLAPGATPGTVMVMPTSAGNESQHSAAFNLLPGRRKITPFAG